MKGSTAPKGWIGEVVRRGGRITSYVLVRESRGGWRVACWRRARAARGRFLP